MTCPVIFRDSDDNKQEATIAYSGLFLDDGKYLVTWCKVLDLFEDEVKSGDANEDAKVAIALAEKVDLEDHPYGVIVDCEIEFEIMEADEKRKAA